MEDRSNANKEKKYVLYTVVGEEKERAGVGVWVVRILLATLLLIALAVVPYVSLRLAQVNDRTLVVFQPVLVHNRSKDHSTVSHKSVHNLPLRPGSAGVTEALKSASLIKDSHILTTEESMQNKTIKTSNSTIITLHETAVTLSFIEDTSNVSKTNNSTIEVPLMEPVENEVTEENNSTLFTSESPKDIRNESPEMTTSSTSEKTIVEKTATKSPSLSTIENSTKKTQYSDAAKSLTTTSTTPVTTTSDTTSTTMRIKTPITVVTNKKLNTLHPVTHKLAYVATASSGNHVGGVCIWKTNKNITNWSYFYDNIPIEFQSRQDTVDRELRGMLVAVRLWSHLWYDYHVVLRSQNEAINGSKHPTYKQLMEEIDSKSVNHFTYEMEWRFQRDDSLVKMAYSLSRLYRDFRYWMKEFSTKLHAVVGPDIVGPPAKLKEKREQISQELFVTKDFDVPKKSGDLESLFR